MPVSPDGTSYTVQTSTGRMVDVIHPRTGTICIEDIAHQLSTKYRWGGATKRKISVARHSIAVAKLTQQAYCNPDLTLMALLHDAHETYLGDILNPVKLWMGEHYERLEARLQHYIFKYLLPMEADFGEMFHLAEVDGDFIYHYSPTWHNLIEKIDKEVGDAEALCYMPDPFWVRKPVELQLSETFLEVIGYDSIARDPKTDEDEFLTHYQTWYRKSWELHNQ